jgi:hypothetical protein
VGDNVVYLPKWGKGISLDLAKELEANRIRSRIVSIAKDNRVTPEDAKLVWGRIGTASSEFDWDPYWYRDLETGNLSEKQHRDWNDLIPRSFPMMSLFDRLPVSKRVQENKERFELLRRGGRFLDVSSAELAGGLIVLAQSDDVPLPFPMEVEGSKVEGRGRVYYQAVLPIDRSAAESVTTKPTTTTVEGSGFGVEGLERASTE